MSLHAPTFNQLGGEDVRCGKHGRNVPSEQYGIELSCKIVLLLIISSSGAIY